MDCPYCNKTLKNNRGLTQHMETVHGRAGVQRGVQSWENGRHQRGEITIADAEIGDYCYDVDDSYFNYSTDSWECQMCFKNIIKQKNR